MALISYSRSYSRISPRVLINRATSSVPLFCTLPENGLFPDFFQKEFLWSIFKVVNLLTREHTWFFTPRKKASFFEVEARFRCEEGNA